MATRTFNAAAYYATIKPVEGEAATTTVKVDGHATKLQGEPTTYNDAELEGLARAQSETVKLGTPKYVTNAGKQARTSKPLSGEQLGDFFQHHTRGTMPDDKPRNGKPSRNGKPETNPTTNGEPVVN